MENRIKRVARQYGVSEEELRCELKKKVSLNSEEPTIKEMVFKIKKLLEEAGLMCEELINLPLMNMPDRLLESLYDGIEDSKEDLEKVRKYFATYKSNR